jgi:hypothetical protein
MSQATMDVLADLPFPLDRRRLSQRFAILTWDDLC